MKIEIDSKYSIGNIVQKYKTKGEYKGRGVKMFRFIKKLLCKHNYIPYGVVRKYRNTYGNVSAYRMCKCSKCNKVKDLRMY